MLSEIEKLLEQQTGLSSVTVGPGMVHNAVAQRMTACAVEDLSAYWQLLHSSDGELQELIDTVVIPETWFFRNREAFEAMVQHVTSHLQTHRRVGQTLRLLSLPCASGEEPYSMAMALLDGGLEPGAFAIEAVDVSVRYVEQARRAIYGRNSFRGDDLAFRENYFETVGERFRPRRRVRESVSFSTGNLFDPDLPALAKPFDIIFCRNLLIYFDREHQVRALARLRSILAPDGLLMVGPAECSVPVQCGFVPARIPMAFAFRREETVPAGARLPRPARLRRSPADPSSGETPPKRAPLAPRIPRKVLSAIVAAPPPAMPPAVFGDAPPEPVRETESGSLEAIERLANAGRMEEAKEAARLHQQRYGPSVAIFYLLGLIFGADDVLEEAIAYYRKALYLKPDHEETLAQIVPLLRRRGDMDAARVLDNRLRRIAARSGAE